ncbi:deoxyribonuclease NucA/NucB-domain-containing protein [Cladorrhinum sp. PSN332]|nr:deoxyribonuclease NucA/NucB-domain-containing protein [Cladorrhinum sp. PSN332]
MKSFILTTTLALSASLSSASKLGIRQNPDDLMIFNCQDMPEVCTNMCWGAFCQDVGEGLSYDRPDGSEKRRRRRAAGCLVSGGNRCSTRQGYDPGYQCDEYPFASTVSNGGSDVRVNRCVPAIQNSRQGGTINSFYQRPYCAGGPCDFIASFGNPGAAGVKYCDAWADESVCDEDDDNQEIGPGGNQDPTEDETADDGTDETDPGEEEPTTEDKKRKSKKVKKVKRSKKFVGRYRIGSGMIIDVPGGAYIGQRAFYVEPLNVTLWQEPLSVPEMVANLVLKEDKVVEAVESWKTE